MTDFVYFIKPIGMDGPVKIGCSINPQSRLDTLMAWSPYPLEVAATVPGGYSLEANIHDCFAHLHSHREWFRADRQLTKAIRRLQAGAPIEQAIDLSKKTGNIRKTSKRGGAAWSPLSRQKMSVHMRVRWAVKKIGINNHYMAPDHILALMSASEERMLTEQEFSDLQDFCDWPEDHRENSWKKYREWKAKQRAWQAAYDARIAPAEAAS